MDVLQNKARRNLLFTCLKFCSEHERKFTRGQRILINQERGQLLHMLSLPNAEPRPVPESIEQIIIHVYGLLPHYNLDVIDEDFFE
ncbi:MAG: hypothetical protein JST78_09690 [Bacteroidetes bacterium]|nr:hypothetical protein [Bacteroidota bacterium]